MLSEQNLILHCSKQFQFQNVSVWNPHIHEYTKIIIPLVSMRNKMKKVEFGMAVIKLLCLCEILIDQVSTKENKPWLLSPTYEIRQIFLFGDVP